MKVGIIGAGTISTRHIQAYQANGIEVVALADRNIELAKSRAATYGIGTVYGDSAELLADGRIDAVSIATPVVTHAAQVADALRAGKHVLCEKPPAMNAEEIAMCIRERDKAGRVLQFGFVRHYDKRILALRDFAAKGGFGKICYAEAGRINRCVNPGGWFNDKRYTKGGWLFDAAIHEMEGLLFILGYPKITSVHAVMGYENSCLHEKIGATGKGYASASVGKFNNDVESYATVFLRTEEGGTLLIRAAGALCTVRESTYIDIAGERAGARWEPKGPVSLLTLSEENGFCEEQLPDYTKDTVKEEIAHFADCIERGATCLAPAEQAFALMSLYDKIYESAETGHEILP